MRKFFLATLALLLLLLSVAFALLGVIAAMGPPHGDLGSARVLFSTLFLVAAAGCWFGFYKIMVRTRDWS